MAKECDSKTCDKSSCEGCASKKNPQSMQAAMNAMSNVKHVIGIACLGGALAMGIAVGKSSEAMARQPEATSQIRTTMMMGLVFIETVIIYALIVAILIIFVL